MHHQKIRRRVIVIVFFNIIPIALLTQFLSESNIFDTKSLATRRFNENPNLTKYKINRLERKIIYAAQMMSLNPRVLGSAIYGERICNYQPAFESLSDLFGGKSIGFAQVHIDICEEKLQRIMMERDSINPMLLSWQAVQRLQMYLKLHQVENTFHLRYKLIIDEEFNLICAALILSESLQHYKLSPGGVDASLLPDISATLYHIRFPLNITRTADEVGQEAKNIYADTTFMTLSK